MINEKSFSHEMIVMKVISTKKVIKKDYKKDDLDFRTTFVIISQGIAMLL